MTREQAAWLLRIGKLLREREERIAPAVLPLDMQRVLERLAASERHEGEQSSTKQAGGWRA